GAAVARITGAARRWFPAPRQEAPSEKGDRKGYLWDTLWTSFCIVQNEAKSAVIAAWKGGYASSTKEMGAIAFVWSRKQVARKHYRISLCALQAPSVRSRSASATARVTITQSPGAGWRNRRIVG